MKFQELYLKDINRELNPAVSADDFTDETVNTEIGEYVFTDEIINGVAAVMVGIKNASASHNGIWVSGYFGSGKSHFMKFIDYCFSSKFGPTARQRMKEAVAQRDQFAHPESKSDVTIAEWTEIQNWLGKANVETVIFNIGSVHNSHASEGKEFIEVFWNQFNKMRGYNGFSIPLAQLVEAPLDKAGKFCEFKERLSADGFDWGRDAYTLSQTDQDMVLALAKELLPSLSVDSVRERLTKNDMVLSVEMFLAELKKYVGARPKDYRLVFFADEISQFIDGRKALLLQLQQVVTGFRDICKDKVWLICTAQLDLSEMLDECHVNQASDDFGKIKGRFEIKVMLKGANVDFITKKRILEKKPECEIDLRNAYNANKSAIDAQYQLPVGYEKYPDENAYVDAYPFVPYQFKLVAQVFNAFQLKGYIDREVKDNARSVLNVTFGVAKATQEHEVGTFVSFDQFFGTMFKGSLSAIGQKSLKNAADIAATYPENADFARRVVNVLFMICNLDVPVMQTFPATIENVTTLLLRDLDTPKLTIKHEVESVIYYLRDKNVLQVIPARGMVPETFQFFTEDEIEVATAIKNKTVDDNTMASELLKVIFQAVGTPSNKESFHSGRFSVGIDILGRHFLASNPAVAVSFMVDANGEQVGVVRLKNNDNCLCFFMADQYAADASFRNAFNWYCQAQMYFKDTPATSETRSKTIGRFREKASETLKTKIEPTVKKLLEACPVLSGPEDLHLAVEKPSDRYRKAMKRHLEHLYPHAGEVDGLPTDQKALAEKIKRPVLHGDYGPLNVMTAAENAIENYLNSKLADLAVTDVVDHFRKVPYGWDENCTLYVLNELVRRGIRDFAYNGAGGVSFATVAEKLAKDTAHFAIRKKSSIPDAVINAFIAAWKNIFGPTVFSGLPSKMPTELVSEAKGLLARKIDEDSPVIEAVGFYPFAAPLKDERTMFTQWRDEANETKFLSKVAEASSEAATRRNQTNQIREFFADQFGKFKEVISFVASNQSNAQFLSPEQKAAFDKLAVAKDDQTPYSNLQSYVKIRKDAEKQFDAIRDEKRAKIDECYGSCFDELEALAESKGVARTAFADRNTTIATKKSPLDLMTLENTINTVGAFRTQQTSLIIAAIPKAPTTGGEPSKPTPCLVHLSTHTAKPLVNESDVDQYLGAFKEELMAKINAGQEVIVD